MSAPDTALAAAPVARLADLPPGTLLAARTADGRAVCLANVNGTVHAVHDSCTHQAFPMSAGEVTRDGCLECAWHGARFDPATGAPRAGPACEALVVYEVTVRDGLVYVGGARDPGPGTGDRRPDATAP